MDRFYDYIESSLPKSSDDDYLYKFKKSTLEKMTARANELTARGLKDENVLYDLVIDENKDIIKEYQQYYVEKNEAKKRRRFALINVFGSLIYMLMLVVVYLGISFSTREWGMTWVIMVDGVLIWLSYILALLINKTAELKKVFHILARLLLAADVMVISVALFIFMIGVLHMPSSWVIIIAGIMLMFVADGIYASVSKQKLAIINWLLYIPAIGTMLFIIVCALHFVSWSTGWLIIPLSLLLDVLIMVVAIVKNNNAEREVIDSWQEN
ncbi:MAG: hypothetical protein IJ851_00615 [Eubacterium sp.]|nr:hypothetical protein [Eubacterium sp.]